MGECTEGQLVFWLKRLIVDTKFASAQVGKSIKKKRMSSLMKFVAKYQIPRFTFLHLSLGERTEGQLVFWLKRLIVDTKFASAQVGKFI